MAPCPFPLQGRCSECFQQTGGRARLSAPVKVRLRLLLSGLPCGRLAALFLGVVPRKSSPERLHLDSPLKEL